MKFSVIYRGKYYNVREISFYQDGSYGIGLLWDSNGNVICADSEHITKVYLHIWKIKIRIR